VGTNLQPVLNHGHLGVSSGKGQEKVDEEDHRIGDQKTWASNREKDRTAAAKKYTLTTLVNYGLKKQKGVSSVKFRRVRLRKINRR